MCYIKLHDFSRIEKPKLNIIYIQHKMKAIKRLKQTRTAQWTGHNRQVLSTSWSLSIWNQHNSKKHHDQEDLEGVVLVELGLHDQLACCVFRKEINDYNHWPSWYLFKAVTGFLNKLKVFKIWICDRNRLDLNKSFFSLEINWDSF